MIGKDELQAAIDLFDIRNEQNAFLGGIEWFVDNLWHETKEHPKEDTIILFECEFDPSSKYYFYDTARIIDSTDYSEEFVRRYRVRRWCYINDIIDRK